VICGHAHEAVHEGRLVCDGEPAFCMTGMAMGLL
jgi:hypothetical protein